MGRELKRVALDFEWPLNERWSGYVNPHYVHCHDCKHCGGTGGSLEYNALAGKWYGNAPFSPEERGSTPWLPTDEPVRAFAERNARHAPEFYGAGEAAIVREAERLCRHWNEGWSHHLNADDVAALVKAGRLMDFTHTWVQGEGWTKKEPAYPPAPREVNAWSLAGFGHDSINQHVVVTAEAERRGIKTRCDVCNGAGSVWDSEQAKADSEAWERSEPPIGEGYQIWETVSEGSPITPVFATPEELARYASTHAWGGDTGGSYETWLKFINGPGWAPTMTQDENGLRTGADAAF